MSSLAGSSWDSALNPCEPWCSGVRNEEIRGSPEEGQGRFALFAEAPGWKALGKCKGLRCLLSTAPAGTLRVLREDGSGDADAEQERFLSAGCREPALAPARLG